MKTKLLHKLRKKYGSAYTLFHVHWQGCAELRNRIRVKYRKYTRKYRLDRFEPTEYFHIDWRDYDEIGWLGKILAHIPIIRIFFTYRSLLSLTALDVSHKPVFCVDKVCRIPDTPVLHLKYFVPTCLCNLRKVDYIIITARSMFWNIEDGRFVRDFDLVVDGHNWRDASILLFR